MQIAIDGPAGAGKSTIAKLLAKDLHAVYVDTGAMYRALTWKALQNKIDVQDEKELEKLARQTEIDFQESKNGQMVVCDGQMITEEIRTPEITQAVPQVAKHSSVRRILVAWQQNIAASKNVVMDGRDIGEKVLPEADFKFYVTADAEERARRRMQQWQQTNTETGTSMTYEQVLEDIRARDMQDAARSEGALKKLPDAVEIDTTYLSIEEAVSQMKKNIGGC